MQPKPFINQLLTAILPFCPIVRTVHRSSIFTIGQVPSRMENKFRSFLHQIKLNFIYCIRRSMVIIMNTIKKEYYRNIVLGKIVMIGPVVKPIGIVLCIIPIFLIERTAFQNLSHRHNLDFLHSGIHNQSSPPCRY